MSAYANRYERVTYRRPNGKPRTVFMMDPVVRVIHGVDTLRGLRAANDGVKWSSEKTKGDVTTVTNELLLLGVDSVIKRERYEVDLQLDELVPEGTARIPLRRS